MRERIYPPRRFVAIREPGVTVRRTGLERSPAGVINIRNLEAVGLNFKMPRAT